MQLINLLDKVREKAASDEAFKEKVVAAYEGEKPIAEFCRECNAVGIEIYPMDIADADESMYAAMRRSTNGGGENSPHLSWEENVFGSLIEEIRRL